VGKQATPFFALTTYSNPVALGAMLGNYLGNGYQTLSMSVVDDAGISLHYFSFNVFTDYKPQGTVPATISLPLFFNSSSSLFCIFISVVVAVNKQVTVPDYLYELTGAPQTFHKYEENKPKNLKQNLIITHINISFVVYILLLVISIMIPRMN